MNKQDGGGRLAGSGRKQRTPEGRSAAAKKGHATRKKNAAARAG